MPIDDLSSVTDDKTVPSASDSTPPATGTELPIINRAVLAVRVSAEELTAVCILKIHAKTVEINAVIQSASFFTVSAIPDLCISGDTEEPMLTAKYPPMSGSTAKLEM